MATIETDTNTNTKTCACTSGCCGSKLGRALCYLAIVGLLATMVGVTLNWNYLQGLTADVQTVATSVQQLDQRVRTLSTSTGADLDAIQDTVDEHDLLITELERQLNR